MQTKTYTLEEKYQTPHITIKINYFWPQTFGDCKTVDQKKRRRPQWNGFNTCLYTPAGDVNKDERN